MRDPDENDKIISEIIEALQDWNLSSKKLVIGDWVLLNYEELGILKSKWTVQIIETSLIKRDIIKYLNYSDKIIKVPKNSKLSTLLVLYGKNKK